MVTLEEKIKQEGDEAVWDEQGLKCYVKRHKSLQHLCGYVGVPKTHPWWGKGGGSTLCKHDGCYKHSIVAQLQVHGGLTFEGEWKQFPGLWFFGFDCAHSGDLVPEALKFRTGYNLDETYRDMEYVKAECRNLAKQLQEVKP